MARAVEVIRGARRPLIVSGGGTIYSEATDALRAFADATGIPVAETYIGKGSLALRPSVQRGRRRRDRQHRGQCPRTGGRRRDRDRHALLRFHDGVPYRIRCTRRPVRQHQRGLVRRREARRRRWSRPTRVRHSWHSPTRSPAGRWTRPTARRPRGGRTTGTRSSARPYALGHEPAPGPVRGHRRGQRGCRSARRRGVRRGLLARRSAQVVADARPQGLPCRVRLSRAWATRSRAAWASRWRPGPQRVRHGRRRLLPDARPGAGHRRAGADPADRRASSRTTATSRSGRFPNPSAPSDSGRATAIAHESGRLEGETLPVDLAANAASLGARAIRVDGIGELRAALAEAKADAHPGPVVIHVETDPLVPAPDGGGWWDVPVAERSDLDSVQAAMADYQQGKRRQRAYL